MSDMTEHIVVGVSLICAGLFSWRVLHTPSWYPAFTNWPSVAAGVTSVASTLIGIAALILAFV